MGRNTGSLVQVHANSVRLKQLNSFRISVCDFLQAPGVWGGKDAARGSSECRDRLVQILAGQTVDSSIGEAVVEVIGDLIVDYRLWKERENGTPPGRAFRSWASGAPAIAKQFEDWLAVDPLPMSHEPNWNGNLCEQLTAERQKLLADVRAFREWVEGSYDPYRPPCRPGNFLRSNLVECIGTALAIGGFNISTAPEGVFALTLETALAEVGLRNGDGSSLQQTMRAAIARHAEWAALIEAGQIEGS